MRGPFEDGRRGARQVAAGTCAWCGEGLRRVRRRGAELQPTQEDERHQRERSRQLRFAGLGLEFAGGIAAFVLLGWWIDSRFQTSPKGLVAGAVLGCVGGLAHLIRSAYAAQRDIEREERRSRRPPESATHNEPDDAAP
jgi:F0F1-type ATP synthase assembly protein I